MAMNVKELVNSVERFRSAMEHCHALLGPPFEGFPRGCCGNAAVILAAYLKDEGFGEFAYVSGWSIEKDVSHAWLERDGYIIDVTADQFQDRANCSMVTEDINWYSQFSDHRCYEADGDFRLMRGWEGLQATYRRLNAYLRRRK